MADTMNVMIDLTDLRSEWKDDIITAFAGFEFNEEVIGNIVDDWLTAYDFSSNQDLVVTVEGTIQDWADDNINDYIHDYLDSEGQEVGELADDVNKLGGAMDTFAERMDNANWEIAALHEQIDYLHNRIAELATPWYTKMWNCAVSAWSSAYSYVKGIF